MVQMSFYFKQLQTVKQRAPSSSVHAKTQQHNVKIYQQLTTLTTFIYYNSTVERLIYTRSSGPWSSTEYTCVLTLSHHSDKRSLMCAIYIQNKQNKKKKNHIFSLKIASLRVVAQAWLLGCNIKERVPTNDML